MKKRILAIFLILALIVALTGCNQNELSLYQTIRNMFTLQDIEFEGTLSCNIKNFEIPEVQPYFLEEDEEDEVSLVEELIQQINGSTIEYSGVISAKDNKISLKVSLKDQDDNIEELFEIIIDDKTVFISKDLIESFGIDLDEYEFNETEKHVVLSISEVGDYAYYFMRESMLYPSFPYELDFEDESYYFGFECGLYDGFYEMGYHDEIPENLEIFELDPEAFAEGYKDGYEEGAAQIEYSLKAMYDLALLKDKFVKKANATNLIKAYQNYGKISGDEFIGNFFSKLELGIVEKDNNKYTISLDNDNILDLFKNFVFYLIDNFDGLAPSIKAIINNLSDDDLLFLFINPSDRETLLEEVDELFISPTEEEIDYAKQEIEEMIDILKSADIINIEYNNTFEKTGAVSFEAESTFSIKLDDYIKIELDIINTLSINKNEKGDNRITVDSVTAEEDGATFNITNENEDVLEVGVVYSKSSDLADFIKVAGESDDDTTFVVNVKDLEPDTTYYYKSYFIDAGNNTFYGDKVLSFTTKAASKDEESSTPSSPDTGSSSANLLVLYTLLASAAVMIVLRKKAKSF